MFLTFVFFGVVLFVLFLAFMIVAWMVASVYRLAWGLYGPWEDSFEKRRKNDGPWRRHEMNGRYGFLSWV